jgi:hypothetical protein
VISTNSGTGTYRKARGQILATVIGNNTHFTIKETY